MNLPPLTIGICTYKRPWYAMLLISSMISQIGYDGQKKFHIADGGSPQEDIDYYKFLTREYETTVEVTSNLSDMVNSCARHGGELFMVILDDFIPRRKFNLSLDARMLMDHSEIGCVRFGRLAFWGSGSGDPETTADLIQHNGLHWWRLDKDRSKDGYMCSIGFHMYHRRFWDAYGDIESCEPKIPGGAEMRANTRFRAKPGPTIAIPMRFGQDCGDWDEPIWHMGIWRSDDYASTAGSRL